MLTDSISHVIMRQKLNFCHLASGQQIIGYLDISSPYCLHDRSSTTAPTLRTDHCRRVWLAGWTRGRRRDGAKEGPPRIDELQYATMRQTEERDTSSTIENIVSFPLYLLSAQTNTAS